jgi:hypothetical protein
MPDKATAHYHRAEIQAVLDAGPHPDETWFRLQVSGAEKSKHLNISPDQLVAIRDILAPASPISTIETFVATMENADLADFPDDEQADIKRAYHLLEAVANEAALRANDPGYELNADERKAFLLIDGDERLASFAATCGSDDLEERLADEIERNDLDISVGRIDFVKVMNYFQNT